MITQNLPPLPPAHHPTEIPEDILADADAFDASRNPPVTATPAVHAVAPLIPKLPAADDWIVRVSPPTGGPHRADCAHLTIATSMNPAAVHALVSQMPRCLEQASRYLRRWGKHDRSCPLRPEALLPGDPRCTCGLSHAITQIP